MEDWLPIYSNIWHPARVKECSLNPAYYIRHPSGKEPAVRVCKRQAKLPNFSFCNSEADQSHEFVSRRSY